MFTTPTIGEGNIDFHVESEDYLLLRQFNLYIGIKDPNLSNEVNLV